jgi:hypothetical protein
MRQTIRTRGPATAVAMTGGAGLVAGALLPWLSVYGGLQVLRGTAGPNGRILLALGVAAVIAGAWFLARGGAAPRWALAILGLAASALAVWVGVQLIASYREISHQALMFAKLGPGVFVAGAGALLVVASIMVGEPRPAREAAGDDGLWVLAAASAVAGLIHLSVAGPHLREWWAFGAFFIGAGAAQLAWALLVSVRPSRRLLVLGLAGNAAVIALWALSRTAGLPLGPEAGTAEAATSIDLAATALELAIVIGASWKLRRPRLGEVAVRG